MKIKNNQDDREKFDNSEIGIIKNKYLKRVKIIGILSIIIGIVWLILNIYYNLNWYEYISPSILLIFGFYFIFNSNQIKAKEINKFIFNNKKTQK